MYMAADDGAQVVADHFLVSPRHHRIGHVEHVG
jgi:hypothetical protein